MKKTLLRRISLRLKKEIWYYFNRNSFKSLGKNCLFQHPIVISKKFIEAGERVTVRHNARIQGVTSHFSPTLSPRIILSNGVSIQQNIHLTCANYVFIGENTAIAANVTITDIHHPYEDISRPIEKQPIVVKEVVIGADCKIYNNAVVLPGVHIGKHVTIGANCVVIRDMPDFSVAVGNPARIVKRYNPDTQIWERTNPDGSFLLKNQDNEA